MNDESWTIEWMNKALCHFCTQISKTRPGEHPEDGEMNQMTELSARLAINLASCILHRLSLSFSLDVY